MKVFRKKTGEIYLGLTKWGFNFNEGGAISFLPVIIINWMSIKYYFSFHIPFTKIYRTFYLSKKIKL